jgi:hypothetical protein
MFSTGFRDGKNGEGRIVTKSMARKIEENNPGLKLFRDGDFLFVLSESREQVENYKREFEEATGEKIMAVQQHFED